MDSYSNYNTQPYVDDYSKTDIANGNYRTPSALTLRKDQRSNLGQAGLHAMGSMNDIVTQQQNSIGNSNSANFGIESLKFNSHYYNLEGKSGGVAGSRHYNDPYSENSRLNGNGGISGSSHQHGRHDANPNALKNMNYIKKY